MGGISGSIADAAIVLLWRQPVNHYRSLPIDLWFFHPIEDRLDLWLHVVLVQIEGQCDRIEAWPELAPQIHEEHPVTSVRCCPGVYDSPVSMHHDVATEGQLSTLIRRG